MNLWGPAKMSSHSKKVLSLLVRNLFRSSLCTKYEWTHTHTQSLQNAYCVMSAKCQTSNSLQSCSSSNKESGQNLPHFSHQSEVCISLKPNKSSMDDRRMEDTHCSCVELAQQWHLWSTIIFLQHYTSQGSSCYNDLHKMASGLAPNLRQIYRISSNTGWPKAREYSRQ